MAMSIADKARVRLMVLQKGDVDYATKVGASDDFALSELAKWLPQQIKMGQAQMICLNKSMQAITAKLKILNAK